MLKSREEIDQGLAGWQSDDDRTEGDDGFTLRRLLSRGRGRRRLVAISLREFRIAFPAGPLRADWSAKNAHPVERSKRKEEAAFRDDLDHFLEGEDSPAGWQG